MKYPIQTKNLIYIQLYLYLVEGRGRITIPDFIETQSFPEIPGDDSCRSETQWVEKKYKCRYCHQLMKLSENISEFSVESGTHIGEKYKLFRWTEPYHLGHHS